MANCCQPFPHGLLLLMAWNMVISSSNKFMINASFELLHTNTTELKGWLILFGVLCVLLPVVGWVGDSLLGRYRVIIAGFILLNAAFLTLLSAFVMLQLNWTQIPVPAVVILCVCVTVNESFWL